jgi:hypothetical protein
MICPSYTLYGILNLFSISGLFMGIKVSKDFICEKARIFFLAAGDFFDEH